MKIFNWVHRRFSHKDEKLAENASKSSLTIDDGNKSAFSNVFLTIGTLGYDQLKDLQSDDVLFYEQEKDISGNNYIESDDDDDDDDEHQIVDSDEEEVNPLVHAACNAHDYESDDATLKNTAEKVRTTLAELFCDSDHEELHEKQGINKGEDKMAKHKSTHYRKSRLSFAMKLIGENGHRPIHKLKRVMRRMLKRKVYPEPIINSVANKCNCSICFTTFPNSSRCKHLMPTE